MSKEEVRTGGCACGAVRYEIDPASAFKPYACHCRDCQTRSGGACAVQMFVLTDGLTISGELVEGVGMLASGGKSRQFGCPKCLTRIYSNRPDSPQIVSLRAGTLDTSDALVPAVHLWTSSKQAWVVIPDDVPSYPQQPADPMEWIAPLHPARPLA